MRARRRTLFCLLSGINIISSEKDMIIMTISNSVLDTDNQISIQERNMISEVHNYRVYFGGGKTSKIDIVHVGSWMNIQVDVIFMKFSSFSNVSYANMLYKEQCYCHHYHYHWPI